MLIISAGHKKMRMIHVPHINQTKIIGYDESSRANKSQNKRGKSYLSCSALKLQQEASPIWSSPQINKLRGWKIAANRWHLYVKQHANVDVVRRDNPFKDERQNAAAIKARILRAGKRARGALESALIHRIRCFFARGREDRRYYMVLRPASGKLCVLLRKKVSCLAIVCVSDGLPRTVLTGHIRTLLTDEL